MAGTGVQDEVPRAQVTPDDQIGLLTGIGDNHLRLEIPAVQESFLDVVEFTR